MPSRAKLRAQLATLGAGVGEDLELVVGRAAGVGEDDVAAEKPGVARVLGGAHLIRFRLEERSPAASGRSGW